MLILNKNLCRLSYFHNHNAFDLDAENTIIIIISIINNKSLSLKTLLFNLKLTLCNCDEHYPDVHNTKLIVIIITFLASVNTTLPRRTSHKIDCNYHHFSSFSHQHHHHHFLSSESIIVCLDVLRHIYKHQCIIMSPCCSYNVSSCSQSCNNILKQEGHDGPVMLTWAT